MTRQGSRGDQALPTTNWIHVRDAGAEVMLGQCGAREELLRLSWPALRAHLVYQKKLPPDRAEDLVQSFIQEKVLQRNLLRLADPEKGKFRTFLLTALDRFVIDCWRKESTTIAARELVES